jgi:flavin reductase (DIM6/NTAB) family NADH-FMN oxidoreductase RutF
MTAAWCGIAAHKPPAFSVALRKERYTLEGVRENGTFSINVPSSDMVKKLIIVVFIPEKRTTSRKSLRYSMEALKQLLSFRNAR